MYTCQCKGCQWGRNSGAVQKEVAALRRCPLIDVYCILMYRNSL